MAKKSPADWKKEGEELKKTIVLAKKNPQNFGLVIAKEGMILEAHKTHNPDKLFKMAKGAKDGTPKGIQGVMSVNGTLIEFKYEGTEKDLPGGIATKWKQYITQSKVTGFKTAFVPSIGEEETKKADEAPAPEETQTSAAPAAAEEEQEASSQQDGAEELDDDALKQKLSADLDKIEAVFEVNYEGMDENEVKELKAALSTIRGAIDSGDLTGAQNMMNKLKLLTGVGPETPAQPGAVMLPKKKTKTELSPDELKKKKKELTKKLADLKSDLQQAMIATDSDNQKELQKLAKDFGKQVKSDKVDEAEETFQTLENKVNELNEAQEEASAQGGGEAQEAPAVSPERQAERANEIGELKKKLAETLAELEAA